MSELGRDGLGVFLELSFDLLAIVAPDGRLELVNGAWHRVLGWNTDELVTMRLLDLVHADDRADLERELAEARRADRRGFRARGRGRDGGHRLLEWTARGHGDGRLFCAARDVTSEQRFHALADGALQALFVESVPDNFRPLYVNDAGARMFGYDSAAEMMALPSWRHLASEEALAEKAWAAIEAGELSKVAGRVKMRHRDGSPLWIELIGQPIAWDGQRALQLTLVDIGEKVRLEAELEQLATTDLLTGLSNRRSFLTLAERELRRVARTPAPLSLLVIDADHFKVVNDRHGHAAGDQVLRVLGETLRTSVRDVDLVCRWGGEEFVILLPGTDQPTAFAVAERIRERCAEVSIQYESVALRVTVSIGVAERRADENVLEPIITRADHALYAAKAAGRNAVRAS